jgi:hypothetical protein
MNNHVEVIGKVLPDELAVKVLFCTDFGSNFGADPCDANGEEARLTDPRRRLCGVRGRGGRDASVPGDVLRGMSDAPTAMESEIMVDTQS